MCKPTTLVVGRHPGNEKVDNILDRMNILHGAVINIDVEPVFKFHHQIDHIQGVRSKILHQLGAGINSAWFYSKLSSYDFKRTFFNRRECHDGILSTAFINVEDLLEFLVGFDRFFLNDSDAWIILQMIVFLNGHDLDAAGNE